MDSTAMTPAAGGRALERTTSSAGTASTGNASGDPKLQEAKDFAVDQTPKFDLGAAFGGHRVELILGGVLLLSIGVAMAAVASLALTVAKGRTATVTVDGSTGRIITENGTWVLTDKTMYNREMVSEFAKRFFDNAYAYDYRAGPATIASAKAFVAGGRADAAIVFPDSAYADRLDQAKTRTAITYDSVVVKYLGHANSQGTIAVLIAGTRTVFNLVNGDATGGRDAAFRDTVFVRTVEPSPQYPEGMAIYGVKGDLTW
jgi:hypothetical protein